MAETRFEIAFACKNCGREWSENFYAGDRVDNRTWSGGPYLNSSACTHGASCNACHRIKCPQCGLDKDVSITKRRPTGLTDGAQVDPRFAEEE